MPGTRHAKNNTALGYFTRHERAELGWGSQKKRLSKESIKHFYACTICLKLCIHPMVCPSGDLFCKECIYQSLLSQKRRNTQKLKEYNQEQHVNQQKIQQKHRKNTVDKFLQFDSLQNYNTSSANEPNTDLSTKTLHTDNKNKSDPKTMIDTPNPQAPKLSCFWIPSLTPNAEPTALRPPDMDTYCPGCNKALRRKQLVCCKFTLSAQDDIHQNINAKNKHKDKKKRKSISDKMTVQSNDRKEGHLFECGSCSKTLTNAIRSVCLSKCGHVICLECLKKFVPKNKACVVCDEPCKKKHVIILSRGGTGFAANGNQIEATKKAVVFQ